MVVSLHIIIFIAVLLVFALAAPLFSPFFRRVKLPDDEEEQPQNPLPPISIVIVEHESASRLEKSLPDYLNQDYPADYQVIVVIDRDASESEDVLKRYSNNPHLYYTMLPTTSRYLSRKKLGITLGIRAAKYDWVVVSDVHCSPRSKQWLRNFAKYCTDDKNLVLGMTPYKRHAPAYYRFEHLRSMLYFLRSAQRGKAFISNQSLVAIRKEEFFKEKGFGGNLEFTRAEFEFLVNKFAKEDSCALALDPEAWLHQSISNPKRWVDRQLFALDARKGLQRLRSFRFWYCLDLDMMHLFDFLTFVAVLIGALAILFPALPLMPLDDNVSSCQLTDLISQTEGIILAGSAALLWLVSQVERCIIYAPVLSYFRSINPAFAVFLEWTISPYDLYLLIRYKMADKNDFITHKL